MEAFCLLVPYNPFLVSASSRSSFAGQGHRSQVVADDDAVFSSRQESYMARRKNEIHNLWVLMRGSGL